MNKKTLENLVYAGAFDGFKDLHRAQYFTYLPGKHMTGLEKIIRFGNVYQTNATGSTNTLFGDLADAGCRPTKNPKL